LLLIAAMLVLPGVLHQLKAMMRWQFYVAVGFVVVGGGLYVGQAASVTSALGDLKSYIFLPVLYVQMLIFHQDKNSIRAIVVAVSGGAAALALLALAQQLPVAQGIIVPYGQEGLRYLLENPPRSIGLSESPNFLAMFLVPGILIASLLTFRWSWICIGIVGTAIVATFSQAAFLALFVAGASLLVYRLPHASWRSIGYVLLCLVPCVTLVATLLLPPDPGTAVRLDIWKATVAMLPQYAVTGIGQGNFQSLVVEYVPAATRDSFLIYGVPYALHPHNLFLAVWLYFGGIGAILITWMSLLLLRGLQAAANLRLTPNSVRVGLAVLIAVGVHGIFDVTYFRADLALLTALGWYFAFLASDRYDSKV
jgi:O-antigen ligase